MLSEALAANIRDKDIRRGKEALQDHLALWLLDVQHQGTLASVELRKRGAPVALAEDVRRCCLCRVVLVAPSAGNVGVAGSLDLHHLGPHIRQVGAAGGCGDDGGYL